jgi:spermidine synthase
LQIIVAIALLGACAQLVQALLIRDGLTVFYGNEVSLGAFYAGWLFWIAVGSLLLVYRRRRGGFTETLRGLRIALLALPLLVLAQLLALRAVRLVLDVSSGQFVPLGELFAALLLITAPSGLVLGAAFPLACRALELAGSQQQRDDGTRPVTSLYVADAFGALVGGLLFTLVLVHWAGPLGSWGVITLACAFMAWLLPLPRQASVALGAGVLVLLGLGASVPPASERLDAMLERLRFATLQPGMELLAAAETRYGHRAVARLGEQYSLVEDGQITASFPQPEETARRAALLLAQATRPAEPMQGPERVLVLDGLAGGLAPALLSTRAPIARLDQVEQDREAFELVRPWLDADQLEDPRLALHFADGRRFVARLDATTRYDLVLALAAVPSSAAGNRYFTRDFYASVREHLTPAGVFCTQVTAASNYLGETVGGYLGSVYRTLGDVFAEVALVPGDPVLLCASPAPGQVSDDAAELARRWQAIDNGTGIGRADFENLLPEDEVRYLRERLADRPAELNTDARPVTYYLNMVLWGTFSASGVVTLLERLRGLGAWPYLLPLGLFVLLWLLRLTVDGATRRMLPRQSGTFALFVLGLAAMAVQLVVLFTYQARVGFMFERIALLNGLFMTGLALGALLALRAARVAGASLPMLLVLTAGILSLLPNGLALIGGLPPAWQEAVFLALALLLGGLTGAGFPLAVALASDRRTDIAARGGLAQAADNLGGAAGGLVAGALMVPLLGVDGTCRVLALMLMLTLPPLLVARLPLGRVKRRRVGLALPAALGWALIYLVLLAYGWHWLDRAATPGPQVVFPPERLAEVAEADGFERVDTPFVHYLGGVDAQHAARWVALSSRAAGAAPSGYGGPLNLLLAVDRDGRLGGVRLIASAETPAYIAGIDGWLVGLRGVSLADGPLSGRVDAMSGATVSSRAALASIDQAAARATGVAFGQSLPVLAEAEQPRLDPGLIVVALLLLLWLPIYLSGQLRWRLPFLAAVVIVLGWWLNSPLTEVDLVNLSLGHAAAPWENPLRWLLIGFVVVATLAFGQVWCGWLCPFGSLQELVHRIGRWLGLGTVVDRRTDRRLRSVKFVLLALMLGLVFITAETGWAALDPMQFLFVGHWTWPMGLLTVLILLAALWTMRPWCRYLCPMGAFLALGNRLALLQRWAPLRRFRRCDLGVRGVHDIDCIRCNRCVGVGPRETSPDTISARRPATGATLTALLASALLLIAWQLTLTLAEPAGQGQGWRDLDLELLQRRIDAGDLRDREADWYHPAQPTEGGERQLLPRDPN